MNKKLLDQLSCPFCGGNIKIKKTSHQEKPTSFYGLLACDECNTRYPAVEGIPIMMPPEKRLDVFAQTRKKGALKKGISVREICKALENDEIEKIKASVVYSIPYTHYTLPEYADWLGNFGKRAIRKILRSSYFDPIWAKYAKKVFENEKTTAYEAMRVYYQEHEHFNYFFYKFGQPRFLTTLGLASIIDSRQKPVLDLACGLGQLMHFLTKKNIDRMAIGVDRNFCELYLAKKFVAPKGHYVCAEADEELPFRKDTFSAIMCSDAFQYFAKKVSCIRGLKEIMTDNGTIILNRIGNQFVAPNQGPELTPTGYLNLFDSMPAKMMGENNLLNQYLNKRKPNLADTEDITQLKDQKWLTIVASDNKDVFKDHGHFDEWPHRVGRLAINPLYKKTGSDNNGNEHYKFTYPSDWYEFEDSLWLSYAPEEVTISKEALQSLKMNKPNSEEIEKHIDRFVILGFPENYM